MDAFPRYLPDSVMDELKSYCNGEVTDDNTKQVTGFYAVLRNAYDKSIALKIAIDRNNQQLNSNSEKSQDTSESTTSADTGSLHAMPNKRKFGTDKPRYSKADFSLLQRCARNDMDEKDKKRAKDENLYDRGKLLDSESPLFKSIVKRLSKRGKKSKTQMRKKSFKECHKPERAVMTALSARFVKNTVKDER